jgi:hypothetical protein
MKKVRRSALVDLVMAGASEEERAEAAYYWYEFLSVLADIAARRARERDSRESGEGDRVRV